jgi:hypothetical protein
MFDTHRTTEVLVKATSPLPPYADRVWAGTIAGYILSLAKHA